MSLPFPDLFLLRMKKGVNIAFRLFASCALVTFTCVSSAQLLPNFGGQRAGLSTLSFLKNDMNTRSMGMGGASVALDGDLFSVSSNPAALTHLDEMRIGLSHLMLGGGIHQAMLSCQGKLKSEATMGFSVNTLNSGSMKVRTEFEPDGNGQYFSVSQTAFGVNYAQKLSDMFNLGINMKYIYEQISAYRNHVLAFDIGFLYETDFRDLKFAVLLQNFGGNSAISGDEVMVNYNRNEEMELSRYTVPTVFKMGLSLTAWEAGGKKLTAAMELNNPNDNAENLRFGAELDLKQILQVQAGVKLSVKGQRVPTFGFRYKSRLGVHPLHVGYAMNPGSFLGNQHLISVQLARNKMER